MGAFDKTIEFIKNTPIEELMKKMKEYGVEFVENKEDLFFLYQEYAEEDDSKLTEDAIDLKNKLIKIKNQMSNNCICKSQLNKLKNSHSNNRNIDLMLQLKKDDEGIVIFENNLAIACFDINYCPMCGKKL